jgi:hypothetical protein
VGALARGGEYFNSCERPIRAAAAAEKILSFQSFLVDFWYQKT